jgi:hypothetical protein
MTGVGRAFGNEGTLMCLASMLPRPGAELGAAADQALALLALRPLSAAFARQTLKPPP